MEANVEARPTRTHEEVVDMLERSYLWNGEKAYFMCTDTGCIGEFSISADCPDEAELLFVRFEEFLGMGWSRGNAFLDAFMSSKKVYVYDSREHLMRNVFIPSLKRDIDNESELTARDLAAFEGEFREEINAYEELMSDLENVGDDQQEGFEELTPSSLFRAMVRGGAITSEDDFRRRYRRSWRAIEDEMTALAARP